MLIKFSLMIGFSKKSTIPTFSALYFVLESVNAVQATILIEDYKDNNYFAHSKPSISGIFISNRMRLYRQHFVLFLFYSNLVYSILIASIPELAISLDFPNICIINLRGIKLNISSSTNNILLH